MNCIAIFLAGFLIAFGDEPKPAAPADGLELKEACAVGRQVQNRIHLVVRGKISAGEKKDDLAGQALLEFGERVLETASDQLAKKVVRHYTDGRAKFVVGKGEDPRMLRKALTIVVGERESASLKLWSPGGQFTSDERELLEDIIDVSQLASVMPSKPVKVGDTWELPPDAVLALFGFDHFITADVKCTLESADDNKAKVKIAGTVQGLAVAAEVKSKVEAEAIFDVKSKLVESAIWKQTDERGGSPINPAGNFEATINVTRSLAKSDELSDEKVKPEALVSNPASKLILFEDAQKRFRFYHDRDWYVTVNRPESAILRRMKNGDFIAQLNVTGLGERSRTAKLTKEEFQAAVEQAGGWKIEQIVKTDELPTDGTYDLQLLTATGEANGVKMAQKHFLASGKSGRQVCFSFVLDPKNEEKLGTVDLSLVGTVEFPENAAFKETGPRR